VGGDAPIVLTCVFGEGDIQCDDGDTCTEDLCLADNTCDHRVRSDVCVVDGACYEDGELSPFSQCDVCRVDESKTSWGDIDCDDGNDCTVDTCDAGDGCANTAVSGTPCDDGLSCNANDVCQDGVCTGAPCGCDEDCSTYDTACQTGACDGSRCVIEPAVLGTSCDSGNTCIVGAICDEGSNCVGNWDAATCPCGSDADCDDGKNCTVDSCNTLTGACTNTVVAGACLLGGECAFAGQNHPTDLCLVCQPAATTTGWTSKSCDDGDPCTEDVCDSVSGECQSVSAAGCCTVDADCLGTTMNACETATCIEGQCQVAPDPAMEGMLCDDGDLCTAGERCSFGVCEGGVAKPCPAPSAACLVATCESSTGECGEAVAQDGAACDDGNLCTVGDICTAGSCGGAAVDCTVFDGPCTTNTCDTATGECVSTVTEGMNCDDGNDCTFPDLCLASGGCQGVPQPDQPGCSCTADNECDDGLACTADTCLEPVCIHTPTAGSCLIEGACVDGGTTHPSNACLVCDPLQNTQNWSQVNCDDGNACTENICDGINGCTTVNNDAASCDDGDPCTSDEACVSGECVGTCECTEAADCVDTVAPPCQKVACEDYTCVTIPDGDLDGAACDDGLFCTENESCQAGSCGGGTPRDCSIAGMGQQCFEGVCDDVADLCKSVPVPVGTACDDGDPCTEGDGCNAGVCQGAAKDCSGLADQCHVPFCDSDGTCKSSVKIDESCNDGDDCTLGDVCVASGNCEGTWDEVNCGCNNDTLCASLSNPCATGRCNTGTGECYADPLTGQACDDGNPCTQSDACDASGGCAGQSYTCSSSLSCQTLTCDGGGGCSSQILAGFCIINNACVSDGTVNPGNPCQLCDPDVSTNGWSNRPNGITCNADNSGCTVDDACQEGVCVAGGAPNCGDGISCTNDACQSTGNNAYTCTHSVQSGSCLIGGDCYNNGAVNPLNACKRCTPSASQTSWANTPNGVACGSQSNTACDNPNTCNGSGTCVNNYESSGTSCGAATECKAASTCNASGSCTGGANQPNGTVCTATGDAVCADCNNGSCVNGPNLVLCHPSGQGSICGTGIVAHCTSCKNGLVPCSICSGAPEPHFPGIAWLMLALGMFWWRRRR